MSELMEIKKKFSLEELSELTGISRRTAFTFRRD